MRPLRELSSLVEGEVATDRILTFQCALLDAATFYGREDMDVIGKLVEDPALLAELRKDAFGGVNLLERHQFTRGDGEAQPLAYHPKVLQFWNINSAIRALTQQPRSGITLCLVRDPTVEHSYFIFGIRNGANIVVLTDRARVPHPDYKSMSRGRATARAFMERATQFWLPYDLLDIEITEDQKHAYAKVSTALVPINTAAVPLADIKALQPESFLWLVMMFDLINHRFWREGSEAPQLSYTGEMVEQPYALVGETASLVVSGHYKPLIVDPLCPADLEGDSQWERESTRFNQWMVDRYAAQVTNGMLNASKATGLLVEDHTIVTAKSLPTTVRSQESMFKFVPRTLKVLDPTSFGLAEDIERDRRWVARRNEITEIQRPAIAEFEREAPAAAQWWSAIVERQRDRFLDVLARNEGFELPSYQGERLGGLGFETIFAPRPPGVADTWIQRVNALSVVVEATSGQWPSRMLFAARNTEPHGLRYHWAPPRDFGDRIASPLVGQRSPRGEFHGSKRVYVQCADSGEPASVFGRIRVNCAEAIAEIMDCKMADLPWWARHYRVGKAPYEGNCILDRLDPADWALVNPWPTLCLDIRLALSKRAASARRKRMGLPRIAWLRTPERD